MPPEPVRKLARYPTVPAALIGWLGRDIGFRGQEVGAMLLRDAIVRVSALQIGVYALCADAIDEASLGEMGHKGMSDRRNPFAYISGQEPRRPHFVRIAQILGFATGQIEDEHLGFVGDGRLAPWTWTVLQRSLDAEILRTPQTSLDRLMGHADLAPGRMERGRPAIRQQDARPLNMARRLRPRPRHPLQISQLSSVNATSITRRGAAIITSPSSENP
jgi:hypothetical protein